MQTTLSSSPPTASSCTSNNMKQEGASKATAEVTRLETQCGWKGSMKAGFGETKSSTLSIPIDCSTHTAKTTDLDSCECEEEEVEAEVVFLGGEPNLLDVAVEEQGVRDIMKALTMEEKKQLNAFDPTMPIRHFRADKGDTAKAIAQIQQTLRWRRDFGVDVCVNCFTVQGTDADTEKHAEMRKILLQENSRGKMYTRGYDKNGRALLYITPIAEKTHHVHNNMRHLVWNMEKAIACTHLRTSGSSQKEAPSLEKINLVIDYTHFHMSHAPPMATTRFTLEILQNHYPERLFRAYLLNPPMVFRVFWSLVKHFVDPVTKEKIVFCSGLHREAKLTNHISDTSKLELRAYGSNRDIRDFDSQEYLHLPFDISFDE